MACGFRYTVYKFGNETLNGNCSVGQLTGIGFRQQQQNGKTLFDAYISSGFLSPQLSNQEVYIRSDGMLSTNSCSFTIIIIM